MAKDSGKKSHSSKRASSVGKPSSDIATPTIFLTPEQQLEFWTALNQPAKLTAAQKALGRLMQGKS